MLRFVSAGALVFTSILMLGAGGCAPASDDATDEDDLTRTKLVAVSTSGSEVPEPFRSRLDAIGRLAKMCTVTHIGDGIAVTAGHCFGAPRTLAENEPCEGYQVSWGLRGDAEPSLVSRCTTVIAKQWSTSVDFAIFRVDPAPKVSFPVDALRFAENGRPVTMFGHARAKPLTWSRECGVDVRYRIPEPTWTFKHSCGSEGGTSGAAVLDLETGAVVGLHDATLPDAGMATYLAATPLAEILKLKDKKRPPIMDWLAEENASYVRAPGEERKTSPKMIEKVGGNKAYAGVEADDFDGKVTKVVFHFPDGTEAVDARRPFRQAWDATSVADGTYTLRVEAFDDDGLTTSIERTIRVAND